METISEILDNIEDAMEYKSNVCTKVFTKQEKNYYY